MKLRKVLENQRQRTAPLERQHVQFAIGQSAHFADLRSREANAQVETNRGLIASGQFADKSLYEKRLARWEHAAVDAELAEIGTQMDELLAEMLE